jgi:cytochrome c oxidase accessory protein FixG
LPTPALVALLGFTYLTYLDAGWLREQVCVYMCPYAKFQSVMYDADTLLVSYNGIKGEPRGSLKKSDRGQCIDCFECVHVCPTGIDIRDGVQIECINCALCLDVCNDVMDATNQPQDLISFTTLNTQQGLSHKDDIQTPAKTILKNALLRIKTLAYIAVLGIFSTLFIYNLALRSPIEASVIPIREPIFRQLDSTTIANDYNIKIANKSGGTLTLNLSTSSPSFIINHVDAIVITSNETYENNIRVLSTDKKHGPVPYSFNIISDDEKYKTQMKTRFVFRPTRP